RPALARPRHTRGRRRPRPAVPGHLPPLALSIEQPAPRLWPEPGPAFQPRPPTRIDVQPPSAPLLPRRPRHPHQPSITTRRPPAPALSASSATAPDKSEEQQRCRARSYPLRHLLRPALAA